MIETLYTEWREWFANQQTDALLPDYIYFCYRQNFSDYSSASSVTQRKSPYKNQKPPLCAEAQRDTIVAVQA